MIVCKGNHDSGFDPADHSDRCIARTIGNIIRAERSRLIPGSDPVIWQIPCPKCILKNRQPYTLVYDARDSRYRCRLCDLDISAEEINDAAKENDNENAPKRTGTN